VYNKLIEREHQITLSRKLFLETYNGLAPIMDKHKNENYKGPHQFS
jgi:hypothetical protein